MIDIVQMGKVGLELLQQTREIPGGGRIIKHVSEGAEAFGERFRVQLAQVVIRRK